jgi:hypothetical protein
VTVEPASPRLTAALHAACQVRGLRPDDSVLIHHYNNAVYLLPSERAVARISISSYGHDSALRAESATRWLVDERGFPATAPLAGAEPVDIDSDTVVSFWRYYQQGTGTKPTPRELGQVLRKFHDLDEAPVTLPAWVPLASLERALRTHVDPMILTQEEHAWLQAAITESRAALADLEWWLPPGMIHGDAWAGNLLWDEPRGAHQVVLGDWDGLAIGPREVDLIPTWHAATRYGKGQPWIEAFVASYKYDLSTWPGLADLWRMRDLMQITGPLRRARPGNVFERALRQRLAGMRNGDSGASWTAL